MRTSLHIKGKKIWMSLAAIVIAVILTCCASEILSLEQPATATVGETVNIKMKIQYTNPHQEKSGRLVVAMLVPTGWNARNNNNLTMEYTSSIGSGKMVLIPDDVAEKTSKTGANWPQALRDKFGIGENYLNDLEWVAFWSDNSYAFTAKLVDVNIKLKVGEDGNNTNVKLAYVIAETFNGLEEFDPQFAEKDPPKPYMYYQFKSTPCFNVTGGTTGETIDFCEPQLTVIDPAKALTDDFITISFIGSAVVTPLANANEVYLDAIAYATDGTAYTIINPGSAKTLMAQTAAHSNNYRITMWPRAYFGVPEEKKLDRIEYFVTDKTGTIKVGNGENTRFVTKLKCN